MPSSEKQADDLREPTDLSDLTELDIAALQTLFAQGKASPGDLLEACLARIDCLDRAIGAFVHIDRAAARKEAQASSERWKTGKALSALDGIAIAVKANIEVAGFPCHAGIGAYRDRIATRDADCIARLRNAGGVIVGLVNMHEAAFGATTDNPWFGRSINPWAPDRTCGGSSGGSGAVVAARMVPLALGSDTVGSTRIPASYTGTVGFKPGFGHVSNDGLFPMVRGVDTIGIHARSPQSCRLAYELLARGEGPTQAPSMPRSLARLDCDGYVALAPSVARGFEDTVTRSVSLGYQVERVRLPIDATAVAAAFGLLCAINGASHLQALLADPASHISAGLRQTLLSVSPYSAPALIEARDVIEQAAEAVRAAMGCHAAMLMPTTPSTAEPFGPDAGGLDVVATTMLANLTAMPAIAFPIGLDASGLPLSVQAIGWNADAVFALAEQLAVDVGSPDLAWAKAPA